METVFLRTLPLSLPAGTSSFDGMPIDQYAEQLLHTYGHDTAVPLAVSSNGNCFFNSLSVAFTGSEGLAPHLRLRCTIYCLLHAESLSDQEYSNTMLTPSLADDMKAICQDGGYSSFRAFVAAAEVLQCKIESVYLPDNGNGDKVCGILNRNITPSMASSSAAAADVTEVRIIWTRTQEPDTGGVCVCQTTLSHWYTKVPSLSHTTESHQPVEMISH